MGKVPRALGRILLEYGTLIERELSGRKLWQNFIYGNGEVQSLQDQRAHFYHHISLLSLFLNLRTISSIGTLKPQMDEAGLDLKVL